MLDKNIEIYIDRIVLDGFDHMNRGELNTIVQEHLKTLIAEQGLTNGLMNSPYHRKLNGGEMKIGNKPQVGQLGGKIASGIYNSINSNE